MFAWFQRVLPRTGDFFGMFEAHAVTLVGGANALAKLVDGGTAHRQHIAEIHRFEHQADDVIRQVLTTVRKTFLTPFDRGAITSLISAMDNAIDEMNAAAGAVSLYEFTAYDDDMRDMTAIIIDAAGVNAEAIHLLR